MSIHRISTLVKVYVIPVWQGIVWCQDQNVNNNKDHMTIYSALITLYIDWRYRGVDIQCVSIYSVITEKYHQ